MKFASDKHRFIKLNTVKMISKAFPLLDHFRPLALTIYYTGEFCGNWISLVSIIFHSLNSI